VFKIKSKKKKTEDQVSFIVISPHCPIASCNRNIPINVLYRDYEYGLTVKAEHRHAMRVGIFDRWCSFLSLLDIEFSVMGNDVSQQSYTKSFLCNDLQQDVY